MHKRALSLPDEDTMLSRLLYRDGCILILDKPSGIAVHPTGHDKIALDQAFHHLRFGLPRDPALAHRLDRETSGCLVLGRHRKALARLGKIFEGQKAEKTYLAIVVGIPEKPEGLIDLPILKSGEGSQWRITVNEAGQPARSHYRLLGSDATHSLMELSPKTGRTHQLRVHAAAMGWPILGDAFYGQAVEGMRTQLHAWKVSIPYNHNKPPITAEAPIPEDMAELTSALLARGRSVS